MFGFENIPPGQIQIRRLPRRKPYPFKQEIQPLWEGAEANPTLRDVCIIAQVNKASAHQGTMDWNHSLPNPASISSTPAMNRCNEALYNADETAVWPYVLCHGPDSHTW